MDKVYDLILSLGMDSAEDPPLNAYLRSLWQVVSDEHDKPLTLGQFVTWLSAAFEQEPPPFDENWLQVTKSHVDERIDLGTATFKDWECIILFQIADLKRMEEAGMLENKYKYFGIDSPSGDRWYNFDLAGYLECAARGIFGFGDDSEPYNPNDLFAWDDFIGFLICGQIYE